MGWKDIVGSTLRQAAPALAKGLIGEIPVIGPMAVALGGTAIDDAIGALIAKAFGVEATPEAVNAAIQAAPSDVAVEKLQAAQAEAAAKWPAFAEIVKAQEQGRTERFRAGTADNADARDSNMELIKAGTPIAWAPVVISSLVIIGYFVVIYVLFAKPLGKVDDNLRDIMLFMLGALQTAFVQVIQYWLGSSAGSAAKDAAMRDITATSVVAAANSSPVSKVPAKR